MSFVVTSEVGRNFDIRSSAKMGDRERSKMVFGEWGGGGEDEWLFRHVQLGGGVD